MDDSSNQICSSGNTEVSLETDVDRRTFQSANASRKTCFTGSQSSMTWYWSWSAVTALFATREEIHVVVTRRQESD